MTERYGQTRISKIYAAFNELRRVIRKEGTPDIQDAWDRVEPCLDIVFGPVPGGKDSP